MFGGIKDFIKIREQIDDETFSITVPDGEIWKINMYVVFTDNSSQNTEMDARVQLEIGGLTIFDNGEVQNELGIEDYMAVELYSVLNPYQRYQAETEWIDSNTKRGIEGGIFLDEGEEIFIEESYQSYFGFLIHGLAFEKE